MEQSNYEKRRIGIHLLRSGKSPAEVAQELNRHPSWVYKWHKRYKENAWEGLQDSSRIPKRQVTKLPASVWQAIRQARSELEAEEQEPGKLSYIGARSVLARLQKWKIEPLPSITSIERELRRAGMVRPKQSVQEEQVDYPHLDVKQPHRLVQVDIVPRYLPGGSCVSSFNAIDVASRYPTGQQYLKKRSLDAQAFLWHTWQTLGIPDYTQVDNESCFSGGFTHPYVLGRVLRLSLSVGTQLIFSPFYHPESNGHVERFHQDYHQNVWAKIELPDLGSVRRHSLSFFKAYRTSLHHSALKGKSPASIHLAGMKHKLSSLVHIPNRLPLTVGKVHFIRRVNTVEQIKLLNVNWDVPDAPANQGVWATLEITMRNAKLYIWDAAPDAARRKRLAVHDFPLKEPVQPLSTQFQRHPSYSWLGLFWRLAAHKISSML